MKWGWLCCLVWIGLVGCGQMQSGTSSETQNTLSVRIVDSLGTPMARVRVEARSAYTVSPEGELVPARSVIYTDDSGFAIFPRYGDSLQVFYAQYSGKNCQVRAASGAVTGKMGVPALITGKVENSRKWVTLQGLGKGTWSDSLGNFSFGNVPAGLVHVRVQDNNNEVIAGTLANIPAGGNVVLDTVNQADPKLNGGVLSLRLNTTATGAHLGTSSADVPLFLCIPSDVWAWSEGDVLAIDAATGKNLLTGLWTKDLKGEESYLWVLLDTMQALQSNRQILITHIAKADTNYSVFDPKKRWRGAWQISPQGIWKDETKSYRTLSGACSGALDAGPIGNAVHCQPQDTIRFLGSGMEFHNPFQISFWIRPDSRATSILQFGSKRLDIGATTFGNWNGWTPRYQTGTSNKSQTIEAKGVIDSTGWSWLVFRTTDLGPDSLIGTWFLNGLPMIMPQYRFAREDDVIGASLCLAGFSGWIQGLMYVQNPKTGNGIWAQWQAQKPNSSLLTYELVQ